MFEMRKSYVEFSAHGIVTNGGTHFLTGNKWLYQGAGGGLFGSVRSGSIVFDSNFFIGNAGILDQALDFVGVQNLHFYNNTLENFGCRDACLTVVEPSVDMQSNRFVDIFVSSPRSLIMVGAGGPGVYENRFVNITGHAGLELTAAHESVNFTKNVWINISLLDYYVKTSELYENVERGTYFIPGNYWDTSSFVLLWSKTYDNRDNLDVAAVSYAGICAEERCETLIEPPPEPPKPLCVNQVNRSISCVIRDEMTVVVPAGTFWATRSIALRHPKALFVIEAGAQIVFSHGTSIQVHEGTLKVVGTRVNPVILTAEIGSSWEGIWFGRHSISTQLTADSYVGGPLLRECEIRKVSSRAVFMEQVSVLLDGVSIQDCGSSAITLFETQSRALLKNVEIYGTMQEQSYGIRLVRAASSVTLRNVSVSNSTESGLEGDSCSDVFVDMCAFQSSRHAHIRYSAGSGELVVLAR
jgi:hypothetical protein